jgi:hypothetical protein
MRRIGAVLRVGAVSAQLRAPAVDTLDGEGGGSIPTLYSGGGARARVPLDVARVREEERR